MFYTLSLLPFTPSGHTECLDLLLSRGALVDVELPATGTPLYSACVARAADCVMLLLRSGSRLIHTRDPCSCHLNGVCPKKHCQGQELRLHREAAAPSSAGATLIFMITDHVLNSPRGDTCRGWGVAHHSIFVTCQNRS